MSVVQKQSEIVVSLSSLTL